MSLQGPLLASKWKPTGNTGHRIGWFGKIILQIEEERETGHDSDNAATALRWRDATAADFVDQNGDFLEEWSK